MYYTQGKDDMHMYNCMLTFSEAMEQIQMLFRCTTEKAFNIVDMDTEKIFLTVYHIKKHGKEMEDRGVKLFPQRTFPTGTVQEYRSLCEQV